MNLQTALEAQGLVSVVGAGGKKSTLYTLAERVDRAVVTATVRIPIFDEHVAVVRVTEEPTQAIEAATAWPLGLVPERERDDRYRGYSTEMVAEIAAHPDVGVTLVKADGARVHSPRRPRATDSGGHRHRPAGGECSGCRQTSDRRCCPPTGARSGDYRSGRR